MRRILIVVTLVLVAICFVNGSEGSTLASEDQVIAELNQEIDARLAPRLSGLAVAAQLDAWME